MAIHHAKAGEVVDLSPFESALKNATTRAIVKSDTFEVVHLIVPAGRKIADHQVPGAITLHCLEGRVRLALPGSQPELTTGEWIYLDGGTRHSVTGIEDSSLLLTILFAPE
jgi:quercetin dioxygenase-like cupin family protein